MELANGKINVSGFTSKGVLSDGVQQRQTWIDVAKGIGIILVVYGHVARGLVNAGIPLDHALFYFIDRTLYSFHMPLFFFLSGLLFLPTLERKGVREMLQGRFLTIAYPYLIWSLLQGGIQIVLAKFTNGDANFSSVLKLAWQPQAQFWFLYALFFVSGLSIFLYSAKAGWSRQMIVPGAILLYVFKELFAVTPANYVAENLVYFVLGVSSLNIIGKLYLIKRRLLFSTVMLFCLAQWLVFNDFQFSSDLVTNTMALLIAICSLLLVVVFAMNHDNQGSIFISYIGKCSLVIYLMHILAGSGIRIILQKLCNVTDPWMHLYFGVLGGVALPVMAYWLMKKLNINFLVRFPVFLARSRSVV